MSKTNDDLEIQMAPPDFDWEKAYNDWNALGFLLTLAGQQDEWFRLNNASLGITTTDE